MMEGAGKRVVGVGGYNYICLDTVGCGEYGSNGYVSTTEREVRSSGEPVWVTVDSISPSPVGFEYFGPGIRHTGRMIEFVLSIA